MSLDGTADLVAGLPGVSLASWEALDPIAGLALLMIVALLVAEHAHRHLRLPRACGVMGVGLLAGPAVLGLVERAELDPWKPLLDLAIGVLLFELGTRIRPRWLLDNPWLAAKGVAEATLAGGAVFAVLRALGVDTAGAALAGAVAMASSPVIALVIVHDLRSRGQVTERLLLLSAFNSMLAVLALEAWRVAVAADAVSLDWAAALASAVRVLCGSFLLGAAAGLALNGLARGVQGALGLAVMQIAVIVMAAMLAVQFTLSPLLALLVAGMVARDRMGRTLTVEPRLGTAGAALGLMMFLSFGLLASVDGAAQVWPLALAFIAARAAGKLLAVMALARPSGLGWRQAAALGVALQPASGLAVLLTASQFGWPAGYPEPEPALLAALLLATSVLQLSGPAWAQWALQRIARETPPHPRAATRPEPVATA